MTSSGRVHFRPSRGEQTTALLFMGAVSVALLSGIWGKTLFYRDLLRWSYPGIFFFRQSLMAGELPLWCPYLSLGYPFLAEMANAVLYPLSLIYLLFPPTTALTAALAVHYALTGYLMWRLLREWRLSQEAALFGGLVWSASGYLVSLHLNPNYLFPAVWYPALLFDFHRLLETGAAKWLALTGAAWASFFLAGDPQAFLWAGVILLFYGYFAWPDPARPRNRFWALAALTGALTFFLVFAQFLPSLEFGAWCTKLNGFQFQEAVFWSHHPLRLLEWIWPAVWGKLFPPEQFWGIFLGPYNQSLWAGAVYLGLLPLALGVAQIRHWREKPIGFLLITLLLFLFLALGKHSILFRAVWTLFPPYRIFRYPEKHLAVVTFALAALSGFGFHRCFSSGLVSGHSSWFRGWLILTGILVSIFLFMLAASGRLSPMMAEYLRHSYHYAFAPRVIRDSWLVAAGRTASVASAFLCAFWLVRGYPRRGRTWAWVMIGLTALDLLALGRTYFMPAEPDLYTFEPEAGRRIREQQTDPAEKFRILQRTTAVYPGYMKEPIGMLNPEQWMRWNRNILLPNLALPEGLEELFGFDPAELIRIARLKQMPFQEQTLQMLNVKYLVTGKATCRFPQNPDLNMLCNDTDHELQVTRQEKYFPRAFWVDGLAPARDEEQFLELLADTDLRHNVILLQPESPTVSGQNFLLARILSYRNREVVIELSTPGNGHLVLSDSYFPGWQAVVDGKPGRILRANYLVRAVELAPGEHRVVFSYRPWSWRIGKNISLISWGVVALALFLSRSLLKAQKKTGSGLES